MDILRGPGISILEAQDNELYICGHEQLKQTAVPPYASCKRNNSSGGSNLNGGKAIVSFDGGLLLAVSRPLQNDPLVVLYSTYMN